MSLEEAPIQSFVFEATARAFASFDALTQARELRGDNDNNNNNNSQTLHIAILDNSSRFNIWVGNIGARYPAADQRSADHRLRDAPRPASRILDILRDLCETNHELLSYCSVTDEAFDLEVVGHPISEAHELCLTVADSITSLMKVSVLIRKATPRDKYVKAAAKKAMPEWTPSDRSHVGDKFPKVKDPRWLVERLGDAITARRQFLRYSQEHHERLAGETGGKHDVSGRSAPNATVTATAASTLDFEMIQSRKLHQLKDDDDSYSQAYSRVTYAAAVDSPLKFSSLESVAKGDSIFECPYCWSIVTCKRQREWEVHMLEDLRAYVCTFEGCKTGPFGTRGSTHLEQLALFALPPTDETSDEPDEDIDPARDIVSPSKHHADLLLWQQNVLFDPTHTADEASITETLSSNEAQTRVSVQPAARATNLDRQADSTTTFSQGVSASASRSSSNTLWACPGISRRIVYLSDLQDYVYEDGSSISDPERSILRMNATRMTCVQNYKDSGSQSLIRGYYRPVGSTTSLPGGPRVTGAGQVGLDAITESLDGASLGQGNNDGRGNVPTRTNQRIQQLDQVTNTSQGRNQPADADRQARPEDTRVTRELVNQVAGGRDGPGTEADIYEVYTRSNNPTRHFVVGRVIDKRLGRRPAAAALSTAGYSDGDTGYRRFVMIRGPTDQEPAHFYALPITTYNGQGVAAEGVHKANHGVIYTEPLYHPAPYCAQSELPQRGESPMQTQAILVVGHDHIRPLDPMSRLDYFNRTRFSIHDSDMRLYGKVDRRYMQVLEIQYRSVWNTIQASVHGGQQARGRRQDETAVSRPAQSHPRDEALQRPVAPPERRTMAFAPGPEQVSRPIAALSNDRANSTTSGRSIPPANIFVTSGIVQPAQGQSTRDVVSVNTHVVGHARPTSATGGIYPPASGRSPAAQHRQLAPTGSRQGPSQAATAGSRRGLDGREDDAGPATGRSSGRAASNVQREQLVNDELSTRLSTVSRQTQTRTASTSSRAQNDPARMGDGVRNVTSRIEPEAQPGRAALQQSTVTSGSQATRAPGNVQLSYERMDEILEELADRAEELRVQQPPTLTEAQVWALAQNQTARDRWLASVRAAWSSELARRS
ncbi:hypothetical protein LTR56_011220 [Elasticomyces elasticus]|nr:hypothetical protein LTR56_011220 [Elasticomyces elasticus]KAK3650416.1 hypothetical protein LTR22_012506 [Elasticomyces elasticus]KAK5751423.1 hypothetical protein LTS12_018511 [Elasticomyces elasticus]